MACLTVPLDSLAGTVAGVAFQGIEGQQIRLARIDRGNVLGHLRVEPDVIDVQDALAARALDADRQRGHLAHVAAHGGQIDVPGIQAGFVISVARPL